MPSKSQAQIAAPAVHVDKWRHWSFGEGRAQAQRLVPEGTVLTTDNGVAHVQDMSGGRLYKLPPRSPDAQAWWDANWEKLQDHKLGQFRRRRAQLAADPRIPTDTPNYYIAEGYWSVSAPFTNVRDLLYMATFAGISQPQLTNNIYIYAWPGLLNETDSWLLQPVIGFQTGHPPNRWFLQDVVYHGSGANGSEFIDCAAYDFPVIEAVGYWMVIQWRGAEGFWHLQCYRGNAGNKGPGLQRPVTPGLNFLPNPGAPRGGPDFVGRFFSAEVVIEVPPGQTSTNYSCSDASIGAVFGGLTVKHNADIPAVNWAVSWLPFATFPCHISGNVQGATINGQAQVTLQIGSS